MQQNDTLFEASSQQSILEINKVLKNTYMLLGATLIFSALMTAVAVAINLPHMAAVGCTFGAIALLWFVLPRTANSEKGILVVFGFTGLLGLGLGPTIQYYLHFHGPQIVGQALGGTAIIFFALSAYVMTTKKDFSFMAGFLMMGFLVLLLGIVATLVLPLFGVDVSTMSLAVSGGIIFLMSGFILYDTSRIIHGGERNYIIATASMYLNLYNIFVNLLHLLGAMDD